MNEIFGQFTLLMRPNPFRIFFWSSKRLNKHIHTRQRRMNLFILAKFRNWNLSNSYIMMWFNFEKSHPMLAKYHTLLMWMLLLKIDKRSTSIFQCINFIGAAKWRRFLLLFLLLLSPYLNLKLLLNLGIKFRLISIQWILKHFFPPYYIWKWVYIYATRDCFKLFMENFVQTLKTICSNFTLFVSSLLFSFFTQICREKKSLPVTSRRFRRKKNLKYLAANKEGKRRERK